MAPPGATSIPRSRSAGGDEHDAPAMYSMHRSFSMDSALNAQTQHHNQNTEHMHINGYESIIYEVESEAEAQDFLMGECESDTGSTARSRVVTRRKTQPRKAVTRSNKNGGGGIPRARRNIRKESVDVDVENDS